MDFILDICLLTYSQLGNQFMHSGLAFIFYSYLIFFPLLS